VRVLHISATDARGGAGVALLRLHAGLNARGIESRALFAWNERGAAGTATWEQDSRVRGRLQSLGRRIGLNYAVLPYGFALPRHPLFRWATVVHFHNLHGGYFNYLALPRVTRNKPAVMTLHDVWSFTGHCGYTYECRRWESGCGHCPHLDTYPDVATDRTALEWKMKRRTFAKSKLELISPTDTLATHLGRSLLKALPRNVIPHGIDTALFAPTDRQECRRTLGLPLDKQIVLLGAYDLAATHKGADLAVRVLNGLPERVRKHVHVVAMGHRGQEAMAALEVPCTIAGFVDDDRRKREFYCAADVLLYPTRADIFGLLPLESIACGTPVVASRLPGVDEVVVPGRSGLLCEVDDATAFGTALVGLLEDSATRAELARSAREFAIERFGLDRHLTAHEKLYERVVAGA
jgi:glycosyltransferase involved in cell wall biosynthesis